MPPTLDQRQVVGAKVNALERHITNMAECSRRYGSKARTKHLNGLVRSVSVVPGKRTTVEATFYVDNMNTEKTCMLQIGSLKAGWVMDNGDPLPDMLFRGEEVPRETNNFVLWIPPSIPLLAEALCLPDLGAYPCPPWC